ncbi:MAG: hypothetical protein LBR39_00835, partial [Coriobacteriales bacterium]|nr:hypothetical protein [Coriobacteriales bacterium]
MHYMVDVTSRLQQVLQLIERGDYFTINRPRQFGKTTMLSAIARELRGEYIIIDSSFEGADDTLFSTQESFASKIFDFWAQSVEFYDNELSQLLKELQK